MYYFVGSCMFYVNCRAICGVIDVFGWAQNVLIVIVDNLLSVIHAAETDLDGVAVEVFSKFVVFREMLVCVRYWCGRFC